MHTLRTLKYQPELNGITGGINGTLLLGQLEYWFEKTKGEAFYKFLAPCEDECYRTGDSWCEELGFSKPEFRTAFNGIGKVYKSKKAYLSSTDPFGGKLYLSYYDRIRRRTYYLRNHTLLEQLLPVIATQSSKSSISQSTTNNATVHTTPPSATFPRLDMSSLPMSSVAPPTKTQCVPPITEDYTLDLPTKNTTEDDSKADGDLHHQVITLYHEICTNLPKVIILTPKRRELIDILLQALGGSLSTVRTLFERVKASDFLCGRLPYSKWRALFDWLITRSNSLAILDGKYDTWTNCSPTPIAPEHSHTEFDHLSMPSVRGRSSFNTTYTHNWDLNALDQMAYDYFLRQLS